MEVQNVVEIKARTIIKFTAVVYVTWFTLRGVDKVLAKNLYDFRNKSSQEKEES